MQFIDSIMENKIDINKFNPIIQRLISKNPEEEILKNINELINKPASKIAELVKDEKIPKKSGVYLIYKNKFEKGGFIYVGETDDLLRRLKGDISRGKRRYHTFLNKFEKDKSEAEIRDILEKEYLFSYVETISKEMAFIIEGILIRTYKPLSNKIKGYQKL